MYATNVIDEGVCVDFFDIELRRTVRSQVAEF